ncbi:MAG: tetratricopeptide repeat protein [Acidobacteriia bacterium]|nr:tetratricopeptide repeat protein [Terriglobia bacterium]
MLDFCCGPLLTLEVRRWAIKGFGLTAEERRVTRFVVVVLAVAAGAVVAAQTTQPAPPDPDKLRQHYDAAQNAQSANNLEQAAVEYKAFLAEALRRLADRRAHAGDSSRASELFEQALPLTPHDSSLRLDYAEARRAAGDLVNAQSAAETVLQSGPRNARAHFVLGRILLQRKENQRASEQLETAVAQEPTFEHGYVLAIAYLNLKALDRAATVFGEMLAGFGDTAAIHMEFGRAFAEAGYPEQGIQEFKKVIVKDDKFPGAHYSLGAAYLVGLADAAFPDAAEEFRKELERHPDDFLSLYQLGYIAVSQHQLKEAESFLGRAASLDPGNPDVHLSLGQAYAEADRRTEAEASLRKSIELTKDVSHNHYQVQRAHYLLGRLLLQAGREEEAKHELKIADQLLKQSVASNQGQPESRPSTDAGANVSVQAHASQEPMDLETVKQVEAYEKQVAPAIADSYNNLGAIMANRDELSQALTFFQQAASWNPSLEGIDYNWGRAAFAANQYEQAIAPLARQLQAHPDDTMIRSALGASLFHVQRYREAVETLKPLESQISSDSRLDYIYSVSLVRSGAPAKGVTLLLALAKAMPRLFDVHMALGEAFSVQGDHANAAREFQIALELNPSDADAKRQLASESAAH